MTQRLTARWWMVCGILLATAGNAAAGEFTLGRAVPADSMMYVHVAHNKNSEFIYKHWEGVMEAVCAANIDQEVRRMVSAQIHDAERRAAFEKGWDRAMELVRSVAWGDLMEHEASMFMRITQLPELGVLVRPKAETLQKNVDALVDMLREFASIDKDLTLSDSTRDGARVWTVTVADVPLSINLFHREQVVGLVSSPAALDDVLGLLTSGQGLVTQARFQEAARRVGPAEDSVVFVDMARTFTAMNGFMKMAREQSPEDQSEIAAVQAMLDHFNIIDSIIVTERTSGVQTLMDSYVALAPGAETKPFTRALTANPAITGFEKFIPSNATSFSAWAGMDFELIYDTVLDFVRQHVPDGPALLEQWTAKQASMEFDVRKDLLSWVDGRMISITTPPAVRTPMGGADSLMLIRVTDAEKARTEVVRWIDRLDQVLKDEFNQMLMKGPATDVKAEGFHYVTHPMLAAMLKITYGVEGDWLMIGSSSAIVNKCIATARGESASFISGERFAQEGMISPRPAAETSFTDLSNLGQELAMAVQALPMMTMMIPPTPETQGLRACFTIMSKLGPALAKLNFMRSSASTTEFDGKGWLGRAKLTYVPYTEKADPAAEKETQDKDGIDGL